MRSQPSPQQNAPTLLPESVVTRKLPLNFQEHDRELFSHELDRTIPRTRLLEFKNIAVSADGLLFRRLSILPESFVFPENANQWKLRSLVKFFADNYFLRRTRAIRRDVLWVTDEWSYGYFHWLTDVLARLYVMRERWRDLILLLPSRYESLDFVRASLKCFAVRHVEFVAPNEMVRCSRLFMPTHTAPSGHYSEEAIRGVRALLVKSYGDSDYAGAGERIYISRGRAPKRRILNEDGMREVLEQFGFQTIYAEDLSLEQQINTCSRARYLVSNHGAGLTNMLFMPEGGSVLELRHHSDSINNCYFTLSSALNLNYYYQTCQSSDATDDPHTANLVVDPPTLKANLDLLTGS
ncbi:MAG: glycosyltransferase family 61 protein [Acidobacteriota bacterium]